MTIKAYINESSPQGNEQTMSGSAKNNTEAIIAACVERVMQVLKDKEER